MSKVAFYIDGFNFYFGIKRSFEASNGAKWRCEYFRAYDCRLCTEKVDSIVLVSADTDLIPPLEFILTNYPEVKMKVYFPPANSSRCIKDFGFRNKLKVKELVNNIDRFYRAKMPDSVGSYAIPPEWKRKQVLAEAFFGKRQS